MEKIPMSPSKYRKLRARFAVFATAAVAILSALAPTTGYAFVIEDNGNLPKKEPIDPAAAPAIHVEESKEPIPKQNNAEVRAVIHKRVPMPHPKPRIVLNLAEGKGHRKTTIEINFGEGNGGGGAAGGGGRGDGDD
jgi:hypothetical protein